eukprot:gene21164-25148_t
MNELEKVYSELKVERQKYGNFKVLANYIDSVTKKYSFLNASSKYGRVLFIKDGVVKVSGLSNVKIGEKVEFIGKNLFGMTLNLEANSVGIVIFGEDTAIYEGVIVKRCEQNFAVKIDRSMLGRVVDVLGQPIDGKEKIQDSKVTRVMSVERK